MISTFLRDPSKNLSRQVRFTKFAAVFRLNTPTTFTGTLDPFSERFFDRISPAWGLVGRDTGIEFAGDFTKIHRKSEKGITEWVLTGVGDLQTLADRVTYPNPGRGEKEQDVSHYRARASAGRVIGALIEMNAGMGALPDRRAPGLTVRYEDVGKEVSVETRLKNLLVVCQDLATAGDVVLESVPAQKGYMIRVRKPTVRAKSVVFTPQGGEVLGWELSHSAPTATTVVVGGQGEGANRTLESRTRANEWGRRIEVFKDRRDTDEAADLEKAANEELTKGEAEQTLKLEFRETERLKFGRDFQIGDLVTAVLAPGVRATLPVTQAKVEWDGYQNRSVSLTLGAVDDNLRDVRMRKLFTDISHISTI